MCIRSSFLFIIAVLFCPTFVFAEEGVLTPAELFITADKFEVEIENVGRSVDARTAEEFEQQQLRTVSDSAQTVSGVRMLEVGGVGSPGLNPLEIRGFPTRGTQVLINGLTLSDPSSVNGTFENFYGSLTTIEFEQSEFLKGAGGVLYGSDSQAGVVNLLLKRPEEGVKGMLRLEAGSYDTFREEAQVLVGTKSSGGVLSVSRTDSGGLDTHGNFGNTSATAFGELEVVDEVVVIEPLLRVLDTATDLDTAPSATADGEIIPNLDTERNNSTVTGVMAALTAKTKPAPYVEQSTTVYVTDNNRRFFFDFDGFESISTFEGRSTNFEHQSTFILPELYSRLSIGAEYEHQDVETNSGGVIDSEQRDQMALYLYNRASFLDEDLQIGSGGRVTQISDISKTVATLEASISYRLRETGSRMHSSIAQGFRAPTLFESHGDLADFASGEVVPVGNDNLDEEESLSWDFGIEQTFGDGLAVVDVTFFQIDADQTIIFDFPNQTHVNGGGGKTQGIENALLLYPTDWFYLRTAYTYLDKAEGLDGVRRQRTPRNWFAVAGVAEFEPVTFSTEVRYRDSQELEFFGVNGRVNEAAVTVLDAALTVAASEMVQLYLRADNIFDVNYTEAGYRMPRASVYAGVTVKLS